MIALPFLARVAPEHRLPGGLFRRGVERREPLPGRAFELVGELVGVVGHELGTNPRPGDRDVERWLVGQVRVAGGHRRDNPVHRPALERVHRRRERPVDVPELGVALAEFRHRTVLETEADAVPVDGLNRRGLAVGEPRRRVVAREAHPVAPAELHRLAAVDLHPALGARDQVRFPLCLVAARVGEHDGMAVVDEPRDGPLVALVHPERLVLAGEDHRIAYRVVRGAAHLGAGEIARNELLALPRRSRDRTLGNQSLADGGVDLVAQRPRGRGHPGSISLFGREVQPVPRGLGSEIAVLDLPDVVAELGERGLHVAGEARLDRSLQLRIALAEDVVHHRRGHPGGPELAERLPCLDRAELLLVADQHHARQAQRGRDAHEVANLLAGSERGFVHHQDRLRVRGAELAQPGRRAPAVGYPVMTREVALQGLRFDAGLVLKRLRRRGRRREADGPVALACGEHPEPLQHRRLASAGKTLHRDHPVGAGEDCLDRLFLTFVEAAPVKLGLRDPAAHDGFLRPLARAHQRDGLGFPRQRRVRGPVPAVIETPRGMETALAFERRNRAFGRIDGDRARLAGKRCGQQVGMTEHRLALGKVPHRPGRRIARRPARTREQIRPEQPALRLAGGGKHLAGREPEARRLTLPGPAQIVAVDVALGRPRQQRRAGRQMRIVLRVPHPPRLHRRLDLRAPCRIGVDHLARNAGYLEPPVGMGALDSVSQVLEPRRQLRPVDRPDRHLVLEQTVIDHRPPLGILALHHVGDDGVCVQLGVEVAGRVMTEAGGDRLLVPGPDHRARRGVAHPGLDGVLLDPAEGLCDGTVVRLDDALVAAHQRHQGHGLAGRQRHVAARPVRDAAVDLLAPEPAPAGNLPFEHPLERLRRDGAGEAQRLRPLAFPGAGFPVGRVVLGVVAILLEIPHPLRRRGDLADGRYHRMRPAADAGIRVSYQSIQARYALARQRTRDERPASYPCHRMAPIVPVRPCTRTRQAGWHA